NLYCDISAGSGCKALQRDLDFTRRFLTEFQDRIVYARDYFDNQHQELLNSLGLPDEILSKIYAGNAEQLVANT
ncbi:MAG: amidohydrolase, partial [Lentisphaeria bacterium]|nr:amidohydrolase [Lentisphaeria bacterium]